MAWRLPFPHPSMTRKAPRRPARAFYPYPYLYAEEGELFPRPSSKCIRKTSTRLRFSLRVYRPAIYV